MYNKITIIGNLTRDIELRYTAGGTAVASCGIATTRKFKSQDGTQKEDVTFVDITFFGRTGEVANQYLKKGSKLLVEGRLKLDTWEDKNGGGKRSKHSISVENMVMMDNKSNNGETNQSPNQGYQQPQQQTQSTDSGYKNYQAPQQPQQQMPQIDIDEDSIPF